MVCGCRANFCRSKAPPGSCAPIAPVPPVSSILSRLLHQIRGGHKAQRSQGAHRWGAPSAADQETDNPVTLETEDQVTLETEDQVTLETEDQVTLETEERTPWRQKTGHLGDRILNTRAGDRRPNNLLLCCAVGESPPTWERRVAQEAERVG